MPPQQPTLDNTLGALLLGMVAAALFLGVSTVQTYVYYHKYTRDPLIYKYSVGILWLLDTFHLFLVIHSVYWYAVTNSGNFVGLAYLVWSLKLQIPFNVIIVTMVQSLYIYRVWLLGGVHRSLVLAYICLATLAAGLVIGFILIQKIYSAEYFQEVAAFSWVINGAFAVTTVTDVVIAGAMCYYLAKSKGHSSRLNSRLSRLMAYTVNSGALTSACSLTSLFMWLLLPHTLSFEGTLFFLTKLYVGSYLAMLNSRVPPEQKGDSESGVSVHVHIDTKFASDTTEPASSTSIPRVPKAYASPF